MRVVFHCPWPNAATWLAELRSAGPELDLRPWPEIGPPEAIEAAVVWRPPRALLGGLANLRCICSMGAGVDHLFAAGAPPPAVPITRLVDPLMAERMASYVLAAVLQHHRDLTTYRRQQDQGVWRQVMHADTGQVRVGVMGQGPLGRASARLLARVGYDTAGWSRSAKAVTGVRSFAGAGAWPAFLARADVLVCLLPSTPATRGILDRDTFARLPAGALVINAARGAHLVDDDLLEALDSGHLAGAVLDVFTTEPLPADHPFWRHPKVLITPHVASLSNPASGARQIVAALRAVAEGRPPPNLVDPRDHLDPPPHVPAPDPRRSSRQL